MYYTNNKLRVFKMLKKLMEAEEKAPLPEEPPPAEEVSEPEVTETPTEPEATPEEMPEPSATEEPPPAEEEPAAPETTEETPVEGEEKIKKEKDESEKVVEKIGKLSKETVVDDYSLTSELKTLYQPILNAETLKEKNAAIKTYQKIINGLIKQSKTNEKISDALEKTRQFIRADSVLLANRLFRKLKT
jgi:hypothetical protein